MPALEKSQGTSECVIESKRKATARPIQTHASRPLSLAFALESRSVASRRFAVGVCAGRKRRGIAALAPAALRGSGWVWTAPGAREQTPLAMAKEAVGNVAP